jgi:hypothetical protein
MQGSCLGGLQKYKAVVKGDYKSARQLFWGITKVQGSCLRGLQKYKGVV